MSWPNVELVVEDTGGVIVEIDSTTTLVTTGDPDVQLELTLPGIQGPPGPQGIQGVQGVPGPAGAVRQETFAFASPLLVWDAEHTISILPNVYTYDTNGLLVEGDVSFPTPSTVRVEWAWPMAGLLVVTT